MPKTTPAVEPVARAYAARIDDVSPKDRSIVAAINTAALDRYRTVIEPRGIDCKRFAQNRVVLWCHGQDPTRGERPIGVSEWVRIVSGPDGPELRAKTRFHSGSKDPDGFCQQLWECYRDGDMRAWSVRIIPSPDGCGPPTRDEIRARPELVDCFWMYRKSELGEYSAVAVGGNADALTADDARSILACASRGLALPAELVEQARALAAPPPEPEAPPDPELPPLGGRPYAERRAEVLAGVGRLFEGAREELEMHRDWLRGKV